MSAVAAASPLANGGGLGSPTKEDARWGYVREHDDDSNSTFVFSQNHSHTPSQSSAYEDPGYGNHPEYGNSTSWSHNHGIAVSDKIAPQNHPLPKLLPSADMSERPSDKLEAPPQILGDLSRNGSETDSLLDLYRQRRAGFPVTHNGTTNGEIPPGMMDPGEIDRERWIHRDKLAIIESQEARAAGIKIPQEYDVDPYNTGYSAEPFTGSPRNHEQHASSRPRHEGKRRRLPSQSPTRVESPEVHVFDDPRTPEEIAAELEEAGSPYFQHGLRASSSRIPLATASPLPVPQTHLERNTPLPRKRGTSGNYDDETLMYNKARSRSHSVGSQVLLDDPDLRSEDRMPASSEALSSSPKKASMPSKSQPTSGARRTFNTTHGTTTTQKIRSPSANATGSPAQRPSTRSGPDGRPATAVNRPEGDPPWLATMYKPDPRLPPDQQIIPTHARRLQQEQWEKEGKAANVFGRDFTPLSLDTAEPPAMDHDLERERERDPPTGNGSPQPPEDTGSWPLKPPTPAAESGSVRSARLALGGGAGGNAGYSTIPKVQNSPVVGVGGSLPQLPAPMAVHEPVKQEKEKEAGCGCCVLM